MHTNQFLFWDKIKPCKATQLMTQVVVNTSYINESCFSRCQYIVQMSIKASTIHSLGLPNRLKTLRLRLTSVYCLNSVSHIRNVKKLGINLPKKLISLNVIETEVCRLPSGFFISVYGGSRHSIRLSKLRESNVSLLCIGKILFSKYTYIPKSLRGGYPSFLI